MRFWVLWKYSLLVLDASDVVRPRQGIRNSRPRLKKRAVDKHLIRRVAARGVYIRFESLQHVCQSRTIYPIRIVFH